MNSMFELATQDEIDKLRTNDGSDSKNSDEELQLDDPYHEGGDGVPKIHGTPLEDYRIFHISRVFVPIAEAKFCCQVINQDPQVTLADV